MASERKHPSHETRVSDASSFDEICVNCGATDITGSGWGKLAEPCPSPRAPIERRRTMTWKTTDEVIAAVRDGSQVTEDELRYAVRNLSIWQNGLVFPLARAITEEPVSAKTKRDLKRAYDNMRTGNAVPLDTRLKGGSFEPGISKDERTERFTENVAGTATRLVGALTGIKKDRPND